MPVAVQLRVARTDGERGVFVLGWPRGAPEVLVPVPARERPDGRPGGPNIPSGEQLKEGHHHWLDVFEVLAVRRKVETEPVMQSPAALEVHRYDDARGLAH